MLKNLGFNRPGIRQQPPAAASTAGLDSVLASTVFHVDAARSASYPGTGTTWANLVTAPADGGLQEDYNFTLHGGLTFTGTADDAGAYFQVELTVDTCTAMSESVLVDGLVFQLPVVLLLLATG